MTSSILIEIAGYRDSECSPFPCDENKTCGLTQCAPSGNLIKAYQALKEELHKEFGNHITMKLTLLDENVPDYIRNIYEHEHPAIPMIILNGKILPVGRISLSPIRDAIKKAMST